MQNIFFYLDLFWLGMYMFENMVFSVGVFRVLKYNYFSEKKNFDE